MYGCWLMARLLPIAGRVGGASIGHTILPRRVPLVVLGFGALFWFRVLMPVSKLEYPEVRVW